jgi:PST family polysaccharide transporter/O-antigen flippase
MSVLEGGDKEACAVLPEAGQRPPRNPNRRRIAVNFLAIASTSGLGLVIALTVGIYVRRVLGPAAIGQIGWSLAVLSYFTVLVNPGLTAIGQRDLARDPAKAQALFCLLTTLQTVMAVAAVGLLALLALLNVRGPEIGYLLVIQGVALIFSAWNTGWILQANERMAMSSIAALAINTLQIPVFFFLVHSPADVYLYALGTLPFVLLITLFNLFYVSRLSLVRISRLRPTLKGAFDVLRESWPLALAQGAILIYFNCDAIILGFTNGDATVGQYTTAYKLMLVSTTVTAALWNAYFPAFARSHANPAEAVTLSREYVRLLCWMGMPIAALGWACGRHAVELMYGPQFAECGIYFEWLCLNIGVMFLNYGVVSTLVPWGHSKLHFKVTAAAALSNLALNLVVIPTYGPIGAVATTVAAEGIVLVLGLAIRRRLRGYAHPILPIVLPPLGCSAAVALTIVNLPEAWQAFWWAELLGGALALAAGLFLLEGGARRRAALYLRRGAAAWR